MAMNPYAPPVQQGGFGLASAQAGQGYHMLGDVLVVEKGTALPDICIFTGQPTSGERMQRKLQWAPPWLAALVVISPLIYVIVYFIIRKTGEVSFAVSPEAKKRRSTGIVIGVGGSLASVVLMFVGIGAEAFPLVVVGMLGLLVAIVAGAVMANLFKIEKIDEHYVYLKLKPAAASAFTR